MELTAPTLLEMTTMETDERSHPSTWQLLFGANKKHIRREDNQNDEIVEIEDRPEDSPENVSVQLLKALQSRTKAEDDDIGQQCSDALLGKKNAFAPQWRFHETIPADLSADATQRARQLITTRLRVDQQAEAIRKGKTRQQQQRLRPGVGKNETGATERLKRLREIQRQRDEAEKAREAERPLILPQKTMAATKESHHMSTKKRHVAQMIVKDPPATSAARKLITKTAKAPELSTRAPHSTARGRQDVQTNHEDVRQRSVLSKKVALAATKLNGCELRALEEKLRWLRAENQEVTELEERLHAQQHILQIKRRVWTLWIEHVARRRRHEASVVRGFEWRVLQRLWAHWLSYARAAKHHRVELETQKRLVREKQQLVLAERFHRSRHLVLWFQRWRVVVQAIHEARGLDAGMQKRRAQAEQLVARITRAQHDPRAETTDPHVGQSPPHQHNEKIATTQNQPKVRTREAWVSIQPSANNTVQQPKGSKGNPSPKTTATAPSPDAFYVSMLARAEQRKAQREQLKLKYERLEQAKREALAKQVAEREALLEQQKEAEKEAVRERKREQARLVRAQVAQRQVAAVQAQSATMHDRLRLLYHYAWRPWQQAWLMSKRVARNTVAWHALRVYHRMWDAWCSYVRIVRAQRRLAEQEQIARAANYRIHALLRQCVARWKLALCETQQKQLVVRRQTQWHSIRRTWLRWRHTYALAMATMQQQEKRVRRHLEWRCMRVALVSWRDAVANAKRERVRQVEKDLLWQKARLWLND